MPVPGKLHQIWWQGAKDIPLKYASHQKSVREHIPSDWIHRVWSGDEIIQLAQEHFPKLVPLLLRDDIKIIQKCDLGRLLILYVHGGLYLDLDIRALDSLGKIKDIVDTRMGENGFGIVQEAILTNNWLMASAPKSRFCRMMIDEIAHRFEERPMLASVHPDVETLIVTGPLVFRDVLMRPEAGPHATVLHWAQLRPIVLHDSFKEWTEASLKGHENSMDYCMWVVNEIDGAMYSATEQYLKHVRPCTIWPASFAGGVLTGASAEWFIGSLVFIAVMYADYTQVTRVVHGGVQDHSIAFISFALGGVVGAVGRACWFGLAGASPQPRQIRVLQI